MNNIVNISYLKSGLFFNKMLHNGLNKDNKDNKENKDNKDNKDNK
jgi:hypothetical protein